MPLLVVYANGGLEAAGKWLATGFRELHDTTNGDGVSMLMAAAAHGHVDLVEHLLQRGAAVDAQHAESGMRTALLRACVGMHPAVVRRLLEAGARIDLRSTEGVTAFEELRQASIDHGRRAVVLSHEKHERLKECMRAFTEHAAAQAAAELAAAAANGRAPPASPPPETLAERAARRKAEEAAAAEETEEHSAELQAEAQLGQWETLQVQRRRELTILRKENERREQQMLAYQRQAAMLADSIEDAFGHVSPVVDTDAMARGWAKRGQRALFQAASEAEASSAAEAGCEADVEAEATAAEMEAEGERDAGGVGGTGRGEVEESG